jgi:uncharacterized membrane protein
MESILVPFLLIFLFCWFGVTIYNLIAVIQIKKRLFDLEFRVISLRSRLTTPDKTEKPPDLTPHMPQHPVEPASLREHIADAAPLSPAAVPETIASPASVQTRTPIRPAQPAVAWEERLDSLERMVGMKWLNWVGALVTLAGIAFLLKFLYDRGLIGPAGRISIGMGIGIALLYLGEVRFRKLHDLFSQSVSAAGCGALFLTTFLSFKFYEFSGRTFTFAALCWFALFAVALAIVRRGPVLAFLGLLCAYLTPYLLSTGQDQAEALFAYLTVLALAAVVVNALRHWHGITSLAFVFSWIYFVGWFSRFYSAERMTIAVIGAIGLILLAGVIALSRGFWTKIEIRLEECIVIAAASLTGLYYLWDILSSEHKLMLGFMLCGLTLLILAALTTTYRRKVSTPVLESTLLGLASGSLLLVIPASFEANGAMMAWALAAVVFADMGIRARRMLLEVAAGFCLMMGVIVGFSQDSFHTGVFHPIFNRVFLAWLGVILAWFIVGLRYFRISSARSKRTLAGIVLQVAASFMLLALLSGEVISWFQGQIQYASSKASLLNDWRNVVLCVLWAFYPWLWLFRKNIQLRLHELSAIYYGILGLLFLVLLTDFHHQDTIVFFNPVFIAALIFLAGIFLLASRIGESRSRIKNSLELFAHFLCVILLAVELSQGLGLSTWSASNREWMRMAMISVAWACYATVLLGMGFMRNLQAWRWFALSLLGVTLLKVLFIDMAEVRQIWRVLSFMALGALLMVCSYAYSRRERIKRAASTMPAPDKEVNL